MQQKEVDDRAATTIKSAITTIGFGIAIFPTQTLF
jgi:hypothetical protein